jgi:Carboxypeptidase regulatory-like domain
MKRVSRRGRVALLICAGWLLIVSVAAAQTPDTAALRGMVSGPNGAPLSGASLVIEDASHRVVRTMQTSAQGTFAAEGLPVEAVTKLLKWI